MNRTKFITEVCGSEVKKRSVEKESDYRTINGMTKTDIWRQSCNRLVYHDMLAYVVRVGLRFRVSPRLQLETPPSTESQESGVP